MASDTTDYSDVDDQVLHAEALAIVREIVAAMTLRVQDAGKKFGNDALTEWRGALLGYVKHRLRRANWNDDRPTVLAVAADMATIAIILAYTDKEIDKDRVEAAFTAIRAHRRCRTPMGISPAGCWCDYCP